MLPGNATQGLETPALQSLEQALLLRCSLSHDANQKCIQFVKGPRLDLTFQLLGLGYSQASGNFFSSVCLEISHLPKMYRLVGVVRFSWKSTQASLELGDVNFFKSLRWRMRGPSGCELTYVTHSFKSFFFAAYYRSFVYSNIRLIFVYLSIDFLSICFRFMDSFIRVFGKDHVYTHAQAQI